MTEKSCLLFRILNSFQLSIALKANNIIARLSIPGDILWFQLSPTISDHEKGNCAASYCDCLESCVLTSVLDLCLFNCRFLYSLGPL